MSSESRHLIVNIVDTSLHIGEVFAEFLQNQQSLFNLDRDEWIIYIVAIS